MGEGVKLGKDSLKRRVLRAFLNDDSVGAFLMPSHQVWHVVLGVGRRLPEAWGWGMLGEEVREVGGSQVVEGLVGGV